MAADDWPGWPWEKHLARGQPTITRRADMPPDEPDPDRPFVGLSD